MLVATAPDSLAEYAALRRSMAAVSRWLLVPSLGLVLVSGVFAVAAHAPFMEARWVWLKALLGLPMFEGTLALVDSTARRAADLATRAVAGEADPALLAELVRNERQGLWLILVLSLASTALGVWRPRFKGRARR